jgi:hypothetical protein
VLVRIVIAEGHRGKGIGTAAVKELLTEADRHGDTVSLTSAPEWGIDPPKFAAWYRGFGFVVNRGVDKDLDIAEAIYRRPLRPPRRHFPEPAAAPDYAGRTQLVSLGEEYPPLRVPGTLPQPWLEEYALRLLQALHRFGLEPRTDWAHGTKRRSVRILVGDPTTDTHGEVMIGAQSGQVLRGYLTMPGRTIGLAEFGSAGNWATVLSTHAELLHHQGTNVPARPSRDES